MRQSNNVTARKVAHVVRGGCSYLQSCANDFLGVQSAVCKEGNEVSSKIGAQIILRAILGLEIDADSIPVQTERLNTFRTIVEASNVPAEKGVAVETANLDV